MDGALQFTVTLPQKITDDLLSRGFKCYVCAHKSGSVCSRVSSVHPAAACRLQSQCLQNGIPPIWVWLVPSSLPLPSSFSLFFLMTPVCLALLSGCHHTSECPHCLVLCPHPLQPGGWWFFPLPVTSPPWFPPKSPHVMIQTTHASTVLLAPLVLSSFTSFYHLSCIVSLTILWKNLNALFGQSNDTQ